MTSREQRLQTKDDDKFTWKILLIAIALSIIGGLCIFLLVPK
jgi:hypothetical protein